MPEIGGTDPARGLRPIKALHPPGRGELGSMSLLWSTESLKSAVSTGERAIGPRWYSGVQDTVWGLGLSSRATG